MQKLLNISKLKPSLYVSQPSENQHLHSWYVKLLSTGFAGKFLLMYVHQPSLLMVLAKGKAIHTTLPEFHYRLQLLLQRNYFKPEFIKDEMKLVKEGHVISKTDSKSMLASMNALTTNIELNCRTFSTYDAIDLNFLEDAFSDWITFDKTKNKYRSVMEYWKERAVLVT